MLGEWVKNVPKRSNYITNFLGINYTENYKEGELAEGFGLSTEKYPCLYQRKGRSKIREDVTDIFEWDGKLIFVSGGVLFYDGREITSVSSDRKQFAVVNTKLIVWPDKIIVDLTSGEFRRMDTSLETTVTIDEDSVTVPGGSGGREQITSGSSYQIVWNTEADLCFYDCGSQADVEAGWSGTAWTVTGTKRTVDKIAAGMTFIPEVVNNAYTPITGTDPDQSKRNQAGIYSVITGVSYREAKATAGTNYIRSGPGFGYNTVGTITAGDSVKLIGASGEWRRIIKGDVCGWVASGTITPNTSPQITISYDVYKKTPAESGVSLDIFSSGDALDVIGDQVEKKHLTISKIEGNKITFADNEDGTKAFSDLPVPIENLSASLKTSIPDLDYITAHANRLWGVSNRDKTIFVSALGYPDRFYDFSSVTAGSYAVAVGSEGDFTGIVAYSNSVICFKENYAHKVMGDYPSEYYITEYTMPGIQAGSFRSAVVINNVLYYKGVSGVYSYTGGSPSSISYMLGNDPLTGAVGGTDGNNYFMSVKEGKTYVFDMTHGLWTVYSGEYMSAFAFCGGELYSLIGTDVFNLSTGDEAVEWSAEFTPFYNSTTDRGSNAMLMNRKGLTKLILRMDLDEGTDVSVFVKLDDDEWKEVHHRNEKVRKTVAIPVRIGRCDKYRIKLTGTGYCMVRTIYREYAFGSMR